MIDPTLTITIDRTDLALPALVLSGSEGGGNTVLGLTGYTEPALQPRHTYSPASSLAHGDILLGWSWQQAILNFDVAPFDVSTEQAHRTAHAELVAALTQFRYEVTITVSGAAPEVWTCDPGTVAPAGPRTYGNLAHITPEWSVAIPCHPVRE